MHRIIFVIPMAMVMLLFSPVTFAVSGLGFLSKSPIAYFTPEDSRLFKHALYEVLDKQPDGKTEQWKNEQTGHFGRIRSVSTSREHGTTCRRILLFNSAGGVTGKARFNFCRQPDGTWKIR